MRRLIQAISLAAIIAASQYQARAANVPQWPLRNGDFSILVGQASKPLYPECWQSAVVSGSHQFTFDPPQQEIPRTDSDGAPVAVVITTTAAGLGQWKQVFAPEKGLYQLSVRVLGVKGSTAEIEFTSKQTKVHKSVVVSDTPQLVTLSVNAPGGEATVSLGSSTVGAVKFQNASLEAKKLVSAAIPTEKGSPIGGIVLPAKPTLAEQYACYQLQHFVNRMTGLTPGLKGRDPVFPGRLVYIGRAATTDLKGLKGLSADSYLVGSVANRLVLSGNSDESTLYAVFDLLKQQGCLWVTPGVQGEVVPKRSKLAYSPLRKEVPDFDVRGNLTMQTTFDTEGRQNFVSIEDYFDWAVRNRQNVSWYAYGKTSDMGEHRGHGWIQAMNHSYNLTIAPGDEYFKDHPDWYPLIKGVRMAKDPAGAMTQLCVSSQGLRDYTVDLALKYFKENPYSKVFAMNPNDGASYWCECDKCKALDPPGIDWSRNGIDQLFMSDRGLDYANYVADKIAKVYPNHVVEMYAYGCTRLPPVRTKVHKNVLIHYAYWGGPMNKPFMYEAEPNIWQEYRQHLDGWTKAGATKLTHYNYLEYTNQNASIFWFNNITEALRGLKQQYNFMGRLGETETSIESSPTLYAVMTAADWNTKVDYKKVVKDVCDKFYGKAAATMYAYNMYMDGKILASSAWKEKNYTPNNHHEFTLADLVKGNEFLDKADAEVKGDEVLTRRIANARLSHALLTYARALTEPRHTIASRTIGYEAYIRANDLRRIYQLPVWWNTYRQMRTFEIPAVPGDGSQVLDLPIQWDFKTDPTDAGINAGWFQKEPDASWKKVNTDQAWTTQGYSYHGAAWYSTSFTIPAEAVNEKLTFFFYAVDGYCDIYLDGVKIGEQKESPATMWDRPFEIKFPANIDLTQKHHLMVRVQKENMAAGIWKPVSIVKAN